MDQSVRAKDGAALFSWQASGSFQSPQRSTEAVYGKHSRWGGLQSCEYRPGHMDDAEKEPRVLISGLQTHYT